MRWLVAQECGGQARIDDEGYLCAVPEVVGEVAASSVDTDVGPKLQMYLQQAAQEYIVWKVFEREIEWHRRSHKQFEKITPDADGIYRSVVLPGLWLDVEALLSRNGPKLLQVAQQGIDSPEHAAFVKKLQETKVKQG